MNKAKPVRREGVLSRRVGEEWMLYDTNNESVHIINQVAVFVWNMCDGEHTLEDMEKSVTDEYDVSEGQKVTKDVEGIINSFNELGVLE